VKLRLLDDSIRLRLSRGDVVVAKDRGIVEGQTRFPDGSAFTFALETSTEGLASASYADDRVVIRLPADKVVAWANDDTAVSLHGELELSDGGQLTLLVEKDFRCLTARPGENESDLFQNPDSTTS